MEERSKQDRIRVREHAVVDVLGSRLPAGSKGKKRKTSEHVDTATQVKDLLGPYVALVENKFDMCSSVPTIGPKNAAGIISVPVRFTLLEHVAFE